MCTLSGTFENYSIPFDTIVATMKGGSGHGIMGHGDLGTTRVAAGGNRKVASLATIPAGLQQRSVLLAEALPKKTCTTVPW